MFHSYEPLPSQIIGLLNREESSSNFARDIPPNAVRIYRMTVPEARRTSSRPAPEEHELDLQEGFGGRSLAIAPAYDPISRIFKQSGK